MIQKLLALAFAIVCLAGTEAARISDIPCVSYCESDLDCSLNGVCASGKCYCDLAWTGGCCDQLALLPVPLSSSYRAKNVSTWGGNIITLDNTTFHMWIAEMAPDPVHGGGCGLTTWGSNSQITHVVASNPIGPYVRREVSLGIWSHNPIVRVDPNQTLVLWHIGDGGSGQPGQGYCANNGTSPCGEQGFDNCGPSICAAIPGYTCYSGVCSGDGENTDCGPYIVEDQLDCDGTPAGCAKAAAAACDSTAGCNSFGLSGFYFSFKVAKLFKTSTKGMIQNYEWSVWVKNTPEDEGAAVSSKKAKNSGVVKNEDGSCTLNIHYSSSTNGPWVPYTNAQINPCGGNNPAPAYHPNGTLYIVFTDENMGLWRADTWRGPYTLVARGACGGGEDPSLYFDKRGRFHCLYHRAPFSNPDIAIGHAYSLDGFTWYTALQGAANTTIQYEGLGNVVHGKRERPHLTFSPDGTITHFVTGVCINPACNPLDGGSIDPNFDCRASEQYYRCDNNSPGPGWFDRTYTLVQGVRH